MDRSRIIKSAKQDDEKVGFSLKLPSRLKDELQNLSKEESVSMNALIVATLESLINDDCGKELKLAKSLLMEYRNVLLEQLKPFEMYEVTDADEQYRENELRSNLNAINKILGV